ncbi:MAG: UDP-N-acetylglucosamine 2-epimerase (non-hydrolyzing), partial [Bacteroidetes bacterium CG23_combo_of_CG06-09_8_20_14_all_32_9]
KTHKNIVITDAVSFFDILILEKNAEMIFTDSGGVQKEAFFYHKPCLILRPQTEWTELVECGAARLCDADKKKISDNYYYYRNNSDKLLFPSIFGDGKASHFICSKIVENFRKN